MKRIILLAALLLAAFGCATTPTSNNANAPLQPANANANASTTPKAEANAPDADIIAREKQIWDMIKTKNPDGFGSMLADDFIYITDDGVYDKAGTVNGIKQLELTDVSFSDWKVVRLDEDAAVVAYTVNMKGTSEGKPIPPTSLRAGSVWVNRDGKWVGVFHQDTEVESAPPGDMASNKSSTTATPTAEPKPAEPVSDDAIAREKQVWDAIKKKDYERFASFLAEDQLEVTERGVNNKADSVNGVKQVDLSAATLSDFKTVKLDDDAEVVIYMVKGPSPPFSKGGERSSTVWVNRGGKWLAAFHQSTSIKP